MAGKINKNLIKKQLLNDKSIKKMVYDIVSKEVDEQKNLFILEFDSHPVTKELDGGENASNISGTLGGYGNLFSFLGFSKGANPTEIVKNLIKKISLNRKISNDLNSFKLTVNVPSKEDFGLATRLPWESGRSWLLDIERNISGLGAYLYGRFLNSRSGSGIQSKYNYSKRVFRPTNYFNEMYNKFLKKLGVI